MLEWPKLLWSHWLIYHMHFFARRRRILSKLLCFAMVGSLHRLKPMPRNSKGLSLVRGCLGVQVVAYNHIIDDSLRREGSEVIKRSMRGQLPVTMRQLARHASRRALSDLHYLHVVS